MQRILFSTLLGIAVSLSVVAQQQKQKAPNFSLKSADGKTIELAKLKGKVVLLNFWATWCGPCRKEMPDFVEAYKRLKPSGLEIIGVSLDEQGWDVVRPFLKQYGINFPVVVGDGTVANAYGGIEFLPTSFLIDRNGFIVDKHVGMLSKEQLERKIAPLLQEKTRIQ
jgi:cytochrome c biogenesis protein CcmG/thiol:disulfide interchange protein DsbE